MSRLPLQDKAFRAILTLGCILLLAGAAGPDPEREVREVTDRRFAAMVRADTAELDRLLAPDLIYTHSNGRVETREKFLASIASKALVYRSIEPSDVQVRVYGDAAVATGRVEMKVSAADKDQAFAARFTAVYVRKDGLWRLAAWQTTRLEG
jgi:uncharacterized protein (TIGR02246 family)